MEYEIFVCKKCGCGEFERRAVEIEIEMQNDGGEPFPEGLRSMPEYRENEYYCAGCGCLIRPFEDWEEYLELKAVKA